MAFPQGCDLTPRPPAYDEISLCHVGGCRGVSGRTSPAGRRVVISRRRNPIAPLPACPTNDPDRVDSRDRKVGLWNARPVGRPGATGALNRRSGGNAAWRRAGARPVANVTRTPRTASRLRPRLDADGAALQQAARGDLPRRDRAHPYLSGKLYPRFCYSDQKK